MFTGIIETTGKVMELIEDGGNLHLVVESSISAELKEDQSVSHNGVCLTVTEIVGNTHRVTAIAETLQKTNLSQLQEGDEINLERCTKVGDRLDGHIVQGHVDQTAECIAVEPQNGSHVLTFRYHPSRQNLVVEKGSICINGISLTAFAVHDNRFSVAIIPYTYQHTNIGRIRPGSNVNLEFDIVGKYIAALADRLP